MVEDASSGYKEIKHVADLAIEAWSPTIAGLLVEAVAGFNHITGCSREVTRNRESRLEVPPGDTVDLIVYILSELVYLLETGFVVDPSSIVLMPGNPQVVCFYSGKFSNPIKQIKAVTYHGMQVTHNNNLYRVKIVFDV